MIGAVFRGVDRVATAFAFVAGAAVLILALLIAVDVVARKVFGVSLQGTDEIGGYVLAMVGSLGMLHVLSRREFTRIDLLLRVLPPPLTRALHVLAYVALACMVVFFARHALKTFDETLLFQTRANTPLQTPMWIPQGLWTLGMVAFAAMAVLHALRAVTLLAVAPGRIDAEYGAARAEDEVRDYTSADGAAFDEAPDARR